MIVERDNGGRRIQVSISTHRAIYPWESGQVPDMTNIPAYESLRSSCGAFCNDSVASNKSRSKKYKRHVVQEYTVTRNYSLLPWCLILLGCVQLLVLIISYYFVKASLNVLLAIDIILSIAAILSAAGQVYREKFFVMEGVGFQITEETYFGKIKSAQFVPLSNFKCIVINETIRMQRVIPYLAVILRTPDAKGCQIIPVFEKTLPRLRVLEQIYQDIIIPCSPAGDN